jgi:hypothetical protein
LNKKVSFFHQGKGEAILFTSKEILFIVNRGKEQSSPLLSGPKISGKQGKLQNKEQWGKPVVVRLIPVGMRKGTEIIGLQPQEYRVNYFVGNNPEKWQTDIPTSQAVIYREAYPGIDLKFYGQDGQLEYDLIIKPGANVSQVKFQYQGIKGLKITTAGDLALQLSDGGVLVQKKPIIYQEIAGRRVAREGQFRVYRNQAGLSYGFTVASYDKNYNLIIDPVLVYSTYLGGSSFDWGSGIGVDSAGNAYITGTTYSIDFPMKDPLYPTILGPMAFVTKINAAGTGLVYSTYLGGSDGVSGNGIAVDSTGNAYITGYSFSSNFPMQNPLYPNNGGGSDVFVAKINPTGSALLFSTYLGGSSYDNGNAISVDGDGNIYVTGETNSSDFPKTSPLYSNLQGIDAFVTKIKGDYSALIYSTYLGGSDSDSGRGIAVDSNGNAYVTGYTDSFNFPIANALYPQKWGDRDAFVTKINASGTALLYSTYLGGSWNDEGSAIAVDNVGNAYVTGFTYSEDFATQNPLFPILRGDLDAFVTKMNPDGSTLIYSTFLGGSGDDKGSTIAVDKAGNTYVTGQTWSSDFPTLRSYSSMLKGNSDAFVTKINPIGTALVYSTYLGGAGDDVGQGLAVDKFSNAYITGQTFSQDFPTKKPLYSFIGESDVFVTKLAQNDSMPAIMSLLLLDN